MIQFLKKILGLFEYLVDFGKILFQTTFQWVMIQYNPKVNLALSHLKKDDDPEYLMRAKEIFPTNMVIFPLKNQ